MLLNRQATDLTQNRGPEVLAVIYPVTGLATLAVIARFYSRKITRMGWKVDDYAIAFSLVLTWCCCASITACVHYGVGRHIGVLDQPGVVRFLKSIYAINLIYIATPAAIKIAALLMYKRIFFTRRFKTVANVFIASIVAWWIAETVAGVFLCRPIAGWWDKTIDAQCFVLRNFDIGYAVVNITVDVVILTLPVRTVWRLKIKLAQKIALTFVFLIGGFECVTALIRLLTAIVDIDNPDLTWVIKDTLIWTAVEPAVGVISVCLITLRPILSHIWPTHFPSSHTSAIKQSYTANATSNNGVGNGKWRTADSSFVRLDEHGAVIADRSDRSLDTIVNGTEGGTVLRPDGSVGSLGQGIWVTRELELNSLNSVSPAITATHQHHHH